MEKSEDNGTKDVDGASRNKVAMSKALGQAFLSHQVRQLEAGASKRGRHGRRGGTPMHIDATPRNILSKSVPNDSAIAPIVAQDTAKSSPPVTDKRIVVDASVLVHALDQVKKWCSNENAEQLVVPLEVLNTLDLLKKGNHTVAAHARAASRFLEDQVGVNTRITVQEDFAVTDWMSLSFTGGESPKDAPQWVRGTLCCAVWEKEHASGHELVLAVIAKSLSSSESTGKWHNRADGELIQEWAERLNIPILPVHERKRTENHKDHGPGWRAPTENYHNHNQYSPTHNRRRSGRSGSLAGGPLVEKPPGAVIPTTGIRLLARGEMLAP